MYMASYSMQCLIQGLAYLTKESWAIHATMLGICCLLSRNPPNRIESSTAKLPSRLATAVEGAAAPIAMFMEAPTCIAQLRLEIAAIQSV